MHVFSLRLCVSFMKITLEKKINNACVFLAPLRFHSHLSALFKNFISFKKYQSI